MFTKRLAVFREAEAKRLEPRKDWLEWLYRPPQEGYRGRKTRLAAYCAAAAADSLAIIKERVLALRRQELAELTALRSAYKIITEAEASATAALVNGRLDSLNDL